MTTFAQTKNTNDLVIENGDIKLAFDKEAYAIIIGDCIRTLKGELQLDVEAGIPYMETVFTSQSLISKWKASVRRAIMNFPFVDGISYFEASVESDGPNKRVVFSMKIMTDKGIIEVTNGK
jgi:hypothetical protein